jgi:rod shape-determining protein MreC
MIRMFDRTRRARLVLILLVITSLVVISIGFRSGDDGPFDKLGRVALTVLGPVQKGLLTIFRPVGHFFAGFTQVPSLKDQIADLEQDNAALSAQLNQLPDVERENETLRRLLVLRDRYDLRTLTAAVIGIGPSNFGRTVFIDKGSSSGVRKNMPVLGEGGLAGRVSKVASGEATVLLLVDRGSAVAARVSSTGEQGVVEGQGSSTLTLRLLDPDAKVAVGDRSSPAGTTRGCSRRGSRSGRSRQHLPPART